jgi:hypothetical protein
LFVLSPLVGEFLLGNVAIDALPVFLVMAPMYGGGAVLVREIGRGARGGWPAVMLLSFAYALVEEGLVTQSLFNPSYFGFDLLREAHVPAFGIGAWWTVFVLTLHTVWSIAVPVALSEALVPERAAGRWLRPRELAVVSVVFVLGLAANGFLTYRQERFTASAGQLAGTTALAAAAVFAALRWRPAQALAARPAPRPRRVLAFSFLAASAFLTARWFLGGWAVVGGYLVLFGASALAVWRWSGRAGWGPAHRLALASGAVLTYVWHSFIEVPIIGSQGTVDTVGNVVFGAAAVLLLAVAARRQGSVIPVLDSGRSRE